MFFYLLPLLLHFTDAQIISVMCHECWPDQPGVNCHELGSQNLLQECTNWGFDGLNATCFAAYINMTNVPEATPEETGVYRGCALRQTAIIDFCTFYREFVEDLGIDIVTCVECVEDGCNIHRFTEDGRLIDDDSRDNEGYKWTASWLTLICVLITILIRKVK